MQDALYTVLPLAGWKEYKAFVDSLSDNWAFRGQGLSEWTLSNAIERTDFVRHHKSIEADFLAEFQRGARNYLSRDEIPDHIIEWLALMQHHGAPTRLLDFSKSPFVAAFFAYEHTLPHLNPNISIWAINTSFIKTRSMAALAQTFGEEVAANKNGINEALFEKIFYHNNCSIVFPVEPFRMNRRYSLQQSIFLSTGNGYEPFMQQLEFLGSEAARALIKIELPSAEQKEVLRDLQRMNMNRASLFPDLDGYAASLRLKYHSMRTPQEQLQQQIQLLQDQSFQFLP